MLKLLGMGRVVELVHKEDEKERFTALLIVAVLSCGGCIMHLLQSHFLCV